MSHIQISDLNDNVAPIEPAHDRVRGGIHIPKFQQEVLAPVYEISASRVEASYALDG